jgi:hypothetical protein
MSETQPTAIDPTPGAPSPEPTETAPIPPAVTTASQPTPMDATVSSWRDALPEDLRSNPSITKFQSPEELAKSYLHAQRFVGGEKMPAPQESWKEDGPEWQEFFRIMGRPDTPGDYDLSRFDPPEGVPWDPGFLDTMVERLHGRGVSQRQLEGVLEDYKEVIAEQWSSFQKNAEHAQEQATASLKREWGNAYPGKVDAAGRAFKLATGRQHQEVASLRLEDGTLLGNHPAIIKAFAALGDKFSEHGIEGDKNVRFTMTPEDAQQQIKRLNADEKFTKVLDDANDPEHDEAVKRMNGLYAMAYPEPA